MKLSLILAVAARHISNLANELEQIENGEHALTGKTSVNSSNEPQTETQSEPSKRTRRTKAQMEADKATPEVETQMEVPPVIEETETPPEIPQEALVQSTLDDFRRLGNDVCRSSPSGRAKIDALLKKLGVKHSSELTAEQINIACAECLNILQAGKAANEF